MEENKKKKVIVTIIAIIVLLCAIVTATYAWFSAKSKTDEQQITTAKVDLIVEVDEENTHIENLKPTKWSSVIEENKSNTKIAKIPINVINKSSIAVRYYLRLLTEGLELNSDITLTGGDLGDIKYVLLDNKNNEVTMGDFTDPKLEQTMINGKDIKKNETQQYVLYVYIEEVEDLQNKLQGLSFDLIINGDTKASKLNEVIFENEEIITDPPKFTTSSQDRGLFEIKTEKGKIYFYKGSTENSTIKPEYKMNNYVEFGTYKRDITNDSTGTNIIAKKGDPILWRIMRINEDNSITLVTEYNVDPPIIYSLDESVIYKDSNLENILETWYKETFVEPELEKLILISNYCNDKQNDYTSVSSRVSSASPSLNCAESDIVSSKIGTVTADDLIFSGALASTSVSIITYMYNGFEFWTMSPASNSTIYYLGIQSHDLYSTNPTTSVNGGLKMARPVITLSPGILITTDYNSEFSQGSKENPYRIITKE